MMNIKSYDLCLCLHNIICKLPTFNEPSQVKFDNGIYFFFEQGEESCHGNPLRIVRVGTHDSVGRLKARLADHYGNRRSKSAFRRHLYSAIVKQMESQGNNQHYEEWELEKRVTQVLCSKFRFVAVRLDNVNLCNSLEKKLIPSIYQCPHCMPSASWLGKYAHNKRVNKGNLWNSEYTSWPTVDMNDIKQFESIVFKQI